MNTWYLYRKYDIENIVLQVNVTGKVSCMVWIIDDVVDLNFNGSAYVERVKIEGMSQCCKEIKC